MAEINLNSPNVHIARDDRGNIAHIEHIREPIISDPVPGPPLPGTVERMLASQYIQAASGPNIYDLESFSVNWEPPQIPSNPFDGPADPRLHLAATKSLNGYTVVSFVQTVFGIEVWQSGVSISMLGEPLGGPLIATSSQSTVHLHVKLESEPDVRPAPDDPFLPNRFTAMDGRGMLANLLGFPNAVLIKKINRLKLLIYKYNSKARTDPVPKQPNETLLDGGPPVIQTLTDVPPEIFDGRHRTVTEVLFSTLMTGIFLPSGDDEQSLNWRAFIDVKTGVVLYLRAFVASCFGSVFSGATSLAKPDATGSVFCVDPITSIGRELLSDTPSPEVALDSFRTPVNLIIETEQPDGTTKRNLFLTDDFVKITGVPVEPTNSDFFEPGPAAQNDPPADFTYSIVAGEKYKFTAVNAYYHCDSMFRMMEKLGFKNPKTDYFLSKTGFPFSVDPQGTSHSVDAQVYGNTEADGVQLITFGAMQPDNGQLGQDVGNAVDVRVVMHEFCHALLYASVHWPNFDFAHSAGDSLAAILCDPGSRAQDLFLTFPWLAAANAGRPDDFLKGLRYHGGSVDKRDDMFQWGWGGVEDLNDDTGYKQEQILSMSLFRVYRAIGGSPNSDIRLQRFVARYMAYLIIQAIFLTPCHEHTTTDLAEEFVTKLMEADTGLDTFDDEIFGEMPGGTVNKVIRWGFEKQGLYKIANVTPPKPGEGVSQPIDVFINDVDASGHARNGEYPFTNNFSTTEIWNRTSPLGAPPPALPVPHVHQVPSVSRRNFIFVKVGNRGSDQAIDVEVRAFHKNSPSRGNLSWDNSWTEMAPVGTSTSNLSIDPHTSLVVGPFEWTPGPVEAKANILVNVSAPGDLSNLDPIGQATPQPSIKLPVQLRWLVPFDNNIGHRTMRVKS